MTEDFEYFEKKKANKTYISPRIVRISDDGSLSKPVRIANKVFDPAETHEFAKIDSEVVLRVTPGRREEIKAVFYEDDRAIHNLVIQRFTRLRGNPRKEYFSFRGVEISRLMQFLDNIRKYHFPDENAVNITDAELRKIVKAGQLKSLLVEDEEALAALMRSGITKSDVIALGYRKQQLERFRRLLQEPSFFQSECASLSKTGEAVWQCFFERNKWIFGYGLTYVSDNKSVWGRELKPGSIAFFEAAPVMGLTSLAECTQIEVHVRLQGKRLFWLKGSGPGQLNKGRLQRAAFWLRDKLERAAFPLE